VQTQRNHGELGSSEVAARCIKRCFDIDLVAVSSFSFRQTIAWGSGGRGFKSRRPDVLRSSVACIYACGAFSFDRLDTRFGTRFLAYIDADADSETFRGSLITTSNVCGSGCW
jgi:hypothetical protein